MNSGEITLLLKKASGGDRKAADELYRLVEKDLRVIANKRKQWLGSLAQDPTTMLVDDVFLRLIGQNPTAWQPGDRGKFFAFAAVKIHDYLVEAIRARTALKRGGAQEPISIDAAEKPSQFELHGADCDFVLDLREALDRFDKIAPNDAQVFRIYGFLEYTFDETAEILQVSTTEVKRRFQRAKQWLQAELKDYRQQA